jgi:hypothetical protein
MTNYDKYTVTKGSRFFRPQPECHLPNSPRRGIIKLFPARKSLISDIPGRGRENGKPFFTVKVLYQSPAAGRAGRSLGQAGWPPELSAPPAKFKIIFCLKGTVS